MDEQRIKQKSIKNKLILFMLLICGVPLLIAVAISYYTSMIKAEEDAEEMNQKQATIVEDEFITLIDQNIRAIEMVAASPSVREYLKGDEEAREAAQEEMVAYLQMVDTRLGDSNSTVLTGPDGMQLARSKGNLVDISTREYFTKAMGGTTYISDVIVSKTTGSRIIVPAVPVFDEDGTTVLGIISRNYDINGMHDFLASEASEGLTIFITDRNGIVIAHSGHPITADDVDDDRSSSEFCRNASSTGSGTYEAKDEGKNMIISYQLEPKTQWIIVVERDYDATMVHAMRSAMIIVVVGIVMLIVAVFIALSIAKSIATPIKLLKDSLDSMANGEFKQINEFTDRRDEFGFMVRSVNSLSATLGEIVDNIKASVQSVDNSASELADTANQISATSDDVANAVQEIATGATQQADEIQAATENTDRISENIQGVMKDASDLAKTADSMHTNSQDSADQMRKLRSTTEQMSVAVDEISEKIGTTSSAVEQINTKVESITAIASQTNLLALNASIEAARAGDAGRGFAVVAEEIGHLADNSAETANEIRKEMDILLAASQSAVKQAGDVHKATEEQKEVLAAAIESIRKLIADIDRAVEGVGTIKKAALICDESKNVVVDAMSGLSAISEENAASSEETSASMQELSATVSVLAGTASSLKGISDELTEQMKFFK